MKIPSILSFLLPFGFRLLLVQAVESDDRPLSTTAGAGHLSTRTLSFDRRDLIFHEDKTQTEQDGKEVSSDSSVYIDNHETNNKKMMMSHKSNKAFGILPLAKP